jgi:putative addiction module killer protein
VRVVEYTRPDGRSPFSRWFESLDAQAAAKITTALSRIEEGNTSRLKWFRGIGECVIDWGPGYRIYLAKEGEGSILLFGGGTKRTQFEDIRRATALHQEYRERRRAESGGA